MSRRPSAQFLVRSLVRSLGALLLIAGLAACSDDSDSVETVVDAPVASEAGTPTGEGPIAVAASSSEAALAERRAEAGGNLKSVSVDFTVPEAIAGKVSPERDTAACSGPGNLVEGEPFEVRFASAADAKVTDFALVIQGTYEGPGSYAADLSWTDASGPQTALGTVYVYDDEMSGEFFHEAAPSLSGTWECRFNG